MRHLKRKLLTPISLLAFLLIALPVSAQEISLSGSAAGGVFSAEECKSMGQDAIDNLNNWIEEYERLMNAAEPVQKGKYSEWIRELNKLKTFVSNAMEKLDSSECNSKCVADQCDIIQISDQQAGQIVKETESNLGDSNRFGDTSGRDVIIDPNALSDDALLSTVDPFDANTPSVAQKSENSDVPSGGGVGDVDDFSDPDSQDNPSEIPKEESTAR